MYDRFGMDGIKGEGIGGMAGFPFGGGGDSSLFSQFFGGGGGGGDLFGACECSFLVTGGSTSGSLSPTIP